MNRVGCIKQWLNIVFIAPLMFVVGLCWAEASLSNIERSKAIAVVVGHSSPVKALSSRQVQKIFMGKLRLYPSSGHEVVAYDLVDGMDTKDQFYQSLVSMPPAKLAKYRASYLFSGKGRLPKRLESAHDLSEKLQRDPGGIGYMRARQVTDDVRVIYQFTIPQSEIP
jgi:ABC-type phosphate transport system substrate-binding protein